MATHTFEEIQTLVREHNKSQQLSDGFVICLIWKESGFSDTIVNSKTTATGLMQLTKGAVSDVNRNTPAGVHFEHDKMTDPMTDPEKNIECGTFYLDLRIKWAKDQKKGIEGYGTGPGYADSIFTCEKCLKDDSKHFQNCLDKIHI
jgi:soluble lytic murein transglycosylase-like protein